MKVSKFRKLFDNCSVYLQFVPPSDLFTLEQKRFWNWIYTCLPISRVKKVKFTLIQGLRLSTGHRGSRGIALLFLDHGTRRGWGFSVMSQTALYPIVQEAGWAPRPVWTGAENLVSTYIRSPDRPARSQSLYPLRYPSHNQQGTVLKFPILLASNKR